MYKLFSPKDYTFLGLVFGVPTALYASFRNGLALKDRQPEILHYTKMMVGVFIGLFVLTCVADIWTMQSAVHQSKAMLRGVSGGVSSSPWAFEDSIRLLARDTRDRLSIISWMFLAVQLVLLLVFVKKAKAIELPVYEALKKDGQISFRSNAELVTVGIGMWILFWLYGQLMSRIMVMMLERV